MFNDSNGGNNNWIVFIEFVIKSFWNLIIISSNELKLCDIKYIIIVTNIVRIFDIKDEKKKTRDNNISNLKNVKTIDITIKWSISIHLKNKTNKNKIACNNTINPIVQVNQKNFHNINSYLFIGLLSIKNIVFHSTSLNNNWLQTNNTQTIQKISIIANQKSTITLLSSQIVNFQSDIENIINTNAKNIIRYKNLFLTISLNVFCAIFNIY